MGTIWNIVPSATLGMFQVMKVEVTLLMRPSRKAVMGNALHQFLEVLETKPKRETFKSINTDPALLEHSSSPTGRT